MLILFIKSLPLWTFKYFLDNEGAWPNFFTFITSELQLIKKQKLFRQVAAASVKIWISVKPYKLSLFVKFHINAIR